MQLTTCVLMFIVVLVHLPETCTRKTNNSPEKSPSGKQETADERTLSRYPSAFSPLEYIFGSNQKDGNLQNKNNDREIREKMKRGETEEKYYREKEEEIDKTHTDRKKREAEKERTEKKEREIKAKRKTKAEREAHKENKRNERNETLNESYKSQFLGRSDDTAGTGHKIHKMTNRRKAYSQKKVRHHQKPSALIRVSSFTPSKNVSTADFKLPVGPAELLQSSWIGKTWHSNTSEMAMADSPFHQPVPTVDHLVRYLQTCDSCLVHWDSFKCPLNGMVMELKKWITELAELLGFGCQLGGNCNGEGKCCFADDAVFRRAVRDMTETARRMYGSFQSSCSNCPRDGGWSEWCEWGACSVTCGSGQRTRTRKCNNPTPKGGGRDCVGMDSEIQPCDGTDCCADGNWSPWSPWGGCSVTCGSGMRQKSRVCSNPSPNHCGRTCPGPDKDMQPCGTNIPCCVDGQWGRWDQWSQCSVSCGRGGTRERRRCCDSPAPNACGRPCIGSDVQRDTCRQPTTCPSPQCVHGNWGQWEPWGDCIGTCGMGVQVRERRCDNPLPNHCGRWCPGKCFDTQQCPKPQCYVSEPPEWTSWENWCPCDCQKGVRSRRRGCQEKDLTGRYIRVHIGKCRPGHARKEEACDVRNMCPVCITDCTGQADGEYPSCTSCSDYIRCQSGRVELVSCSVRKNEWDAFIRKCVSPPSPSCHLVDCVSSCDGLDDGRYPSCFGCGSYVDCRGGRYQEQQCPFGQEFNAHSERCEESRSHTCVRAIGRDSSVMLRDAPADSYFPSDELDEEKRKALYLKLREEATVATRFNRTDEDVVLIETGEKQQKKMSKESTGEMGEKKEQKTPEITEKKLDDTKAEPDREHKPTVKPPLSKIEGGFQCKTDCAASKPGFYQSCKSCNDYLVCTKHGVARHLKCPRNKFWDDKRKKCKHHSTTCMPGKMANRTRP